MAFDGDDLLLGTGVRGDSRRTRGLLDRVIQRLFCRHRTLTLGGARRLVSRSGITRTRNDRLVTGWSNFDPNRIAVGAEARVHMRLDANRDRVGPVSAMIHQLGGARSGAFVVPMQVHVPLRGTHDEPADGVARAHHHSRLQHSGVPLSAIAACAFGCCDGGNEGDEEADWHATVELEV